MYYPIPETVSKSQTVTASVPKTECDPAGSVTTTASFSVLKSTTPREMKSNFAIHEVNRPTEGEWSKIKKSGQIKMTEMSIRKETHTFYLGQVETPFIKWKTALAARNKAKVGGVCKACRGVIQLDQKAAIVKGVYIEQGDLDYWKSQYPNAPHYQSGVLDLDSGRLEAAKSEAIAELYQSYNLGEELAELRETILGVTKLLKEGIFLLIRARSTINGLLKKGYINEASSRWMEFRYGIMPILYSVQDLLEINSEGKYVTSRKTVYSDVEVSEEYDDKSYFETVHVGDLRATVTAKARWASQELKNLDRININPLTTFTAVLPWSMVIRWFFNVQSYLDARVKSLTCLALEQRNCVAVREKRDSFTYLSLVRGYKDERVFDPGNSGDCGAGYYGVKEFGVFSDYRPQRILLAHSSVDNYHRYLYQPSDTKLVYNPYITWKRAIDSVILAKGPLSKLLRSLK